MFSWVWIERLYMLLSLWHKIRRIKKWYKIIHNTSYISKLKGTFHFHFKPFSLYLGKKNKGCLEAPQGWMWVYITVLCLILAPQVGAKRTNRPGISTTDRGFPRARFRSRGGSFSSRARYYSGYTPPRGRGRAFRWADAETPHFWHRGRTLHLHALTHSLFVLKGKDRENKPDYRDQPELAAGVEVFHWPAIMINFFGIYCTDDSAKETGLLETIPQQIRLLLF